MKNVFYFLLIILVLTSVECTNIEKNINKGETAMKISSTAFEDGGMIPSKYTCDDINISPGLEWEGVPEGTKSMAIISDDPDAPMGTWVHWVAYSIDPSIKSFEENVPAQGILPNGIKQGKNDFGKLGYGGPCPLGGTHRYFFKLYALDTYIDAHEGLTKAELLKLMEGHILAEAQLMGKYSRK